MPGTWKPLNHQPTFNASTMLLLTDGTVMCADEGPAKAGANHWWKLTPDSLGSYVNGTWSALANGPNSPLYFASAVLKDGRVFVAGGEYNGSAVVADLLAAEIYDPISNTWKAIGVPAGWTHIGDAVSCVFPDGRLLLGSIDNNSTAIYDPPTNTWHPGGHKANASSGEETWTLLPDGTILTVDCFGHPAAEKYIIASNKWVTAGNTPVELVEDASKEIGPALLLPDGRVFAVGATGNTALYTHPAIPTQPGTWAKGPTFPKDAAGRQLGAKDAPGCLLVNGHVLCAVGPVDGTAGAFNGPTSFFEYDPASNTLTAVANPANNGAAPFNGRMLLLPTGEVLFANGSTTIEVYTPVGAPNAAWHPTITALPASLTPGGTFPLSGKLINGLSQAVSYGDDAQMATNYPIVRLREPATGHIWYCRTANHSSMGVATGATIATTHFTVPPSVHKGKLELTLIANGIASAPHIVTI